MKKEYKVMGILGLIALRKSELFQKIMNELSKEKQISDKDKETIKKYISEMENEIFLSEEEKQSKKVNPLLKLDDINLDIKEIIKKIKTYLSYNLF
jgi:histidyl-tRNA synthetase